jgi:hypothetical protein
VAQSPIPASPPADEGPDSLDFLIAHGGPFFELQRRLGLLRDKTLKTGRRALLFVGIAWGVPLLLTLPTLFSDRPVVWNYVSDPGPLTRFLLAIFAFIAAEQATESGLQRKLRQFTLAPLIAPQSFADAARALADALKQRDSAVAEFVCLILGLLAGTFAFAAFKENSASLWSAVESPEGRRLTAAGWWCVCVSIPIFTFLLLRGIWRHVVWALFLRRLSRLDLRLVSTHPDGKGGLAFLGDYPNAYVLFVFGVSCGVAAAVAKHMMQAEISATTLTTIMAAWLVIVIAFFAYPLSAFSRPLAALKDKSLRVLSARATVQQRAAERKAIGENIISSDPQEAEQAVEAADLSKQYDQTRKLSTMLVNRSALLPVAAAALIPFAVAGAARLPYKEVFSVLKKLLLL